MYTYANGNPVSYTDPTGTFALLGAFVGATFDFGLQMYSNGGDIGAVNWGDVGISAALGATGGGLLGKIGKITDTIWDTSKVVKETTRVGRWMSQAEHDAMKASGKVQESFSGTTHVADPEDASAFINQAKPGSMYVEFNVPTSSLKATNEGWAKIIGPNSLEGRLAARKGMSIP